MKKSDTEQGIEKAVHEEICGIIMPISDTDGYPKGHWQDVAEILYKAIDGAGFIGKIVSDSKVSNIIHNEIVQNISENPIVICDVSSKNPNVMFELGLRLAFDKPTIVIKDDDTDYNFDTSPIRHLEYPKDLRHNRVEEFQIDLINALTMTYQSFKEGKYKTFLQSFTTYVPKIERQEVNLKDYLANEFQSIKKDIQQLYNNAPPRKKGIQRGTELVVVAEHFRLRAPEFSILILNMLKERNLNTAVYYENDESSTVEFKLRGAKDSLDGIVRDLTVTKDINVLSAELRPY